MQAFKKHSVLAMAIIYLILAATKIAAHWHYNLNQALERKIYRSLNTTADPCKDFYEYSCGNYNGFDNSDANVGEITQYLDQKFNKKLIEILKSKPSDANKSVNKCITLPYLLSLCSDTWNHFWNGVNLSNNISHETNRQTIREKTQNYYEACVKENRLNFAKYFDELKIKWPLLSAQSETLPSSDSDEFWQILGQLQTYNWNNLIIKHEINVSKDGALNIILEPGFNIGQPNLPEDNAIEAILQALKVDNATEIVQQLKATEEKWLEIFQNDTSREYTYTAMSLQDVKAKYPFIKLYLQQLLGVAFNKIESIWLRNFSFFNYFREIEWPAEVWQQQLNYLLVHFIFYLFKDSSPVFNEKLCVQDLRNKLDLAVNYIYYEQIFAKEQEQYEDRLNRINSQIETVILELFEENNLNLTTRQVKDLQNKLHQININLGNLPYSALNDPIGAFYKDVPDLDHGNYFRNHLLLLQHRFRKSLLYQDDLNFYITADNSLASSSTLFFAPKQNLVVIPFASVQYPLYHYSFQPEYQLSLMVFLIAHEIGHAFDTNGLTMSNDHSIVEQDVYNKTLECLQQQKSTEDIDERIADLFAERVVYRTYEKYYKAARNTYCQRQFYLSMAQFFCNKGDLEFIDHDADAVRLHQIVKNSKKFARAFGCPLNSPMNPQEKCRLY